MINAMTDSLSSLLFSDDSDVEISMPCHEEKTQNQSSTVSLDQTADCCTDVCLCDDASCHGFSLIFQPESSRLFMVSTTHSFDLSFYSSFVIIPGSPPPIV